MTCRVRGQTVANEENLYACLGPISWKGTCALLRVDKSCLRAPLFQEVSAAVRTSRFLPRASGTTCISNHYSSQAQVSLHRRRRFESDESISRFCAYLLLVPGVVSHTGTCGECMRAICVA
eukprot:6214682-Pleurochrysis_carterae.AAC.4